MTTPEDDQENYQAQLAAKREEHVAALREKYGAHMPADIVPLDSSLTVAGHEPPPPMSVEDGMDAFAVSILALSRLCEDIATAVVTIADKMAPYVQWREESELVAVRAAVDVIR